MGDATTPRILQPDHNCSTPVVADRSGLLIDGGDYYAAVYRAATRAQRYIALSGWQLDSEVELLRGDAAAGARYPVRLVELLDALCRERPSLRVYLLLWDYSVLYAAERELLQQWTLPLKTHDNVRVCYDDRHPIGASHHQKFVVIDGAIAFAGGMDVCASRWDERDHRIDNPHRRSPRGISYGPYHDLQAFVTGPAVEPIEQLFLERWNAACGEQLELGDGANDDASADPGATIELPPGSRVAYSLTRGRTLSPPQKPIEQIRALFRDAIAAAREHVYIENQYFTADDVADAIAQRFEADDLPPIQVALVLPRQPGAVKEQVTLGARQTEHLRRLAALARDSDHRLGVYYVTARDAEREQPVFIHSKLMSVDDRFLTVGSANTTNRSLGLDSELNLSWEVGDGDDALREAIRNARTALIAEHCGVDEPRVNGASLVDDLDALADDPDSRLTHHGLEAGADELQSIAPMMRDVFDPERPPVEEAVWEVLSTEDEGLFARGISALREWLGRR